MFRNTNPEVWELLIVNIDPQIKIAHSGYRDQAIGIIMSIQQQFPSSGLYFLCNFQKNEFETVLKHLRKMKPNRGSLLVYKLIWMGGGFD